MSHNIFLMAEAWGMALHPPGAFAKVQQFTAPDGPAPNQILRDMAYGAVKLAGLDWQSGFVGEEETNRFEALVLGVWQGARKQFTWKPIEEAPKSTEVLVWREDAGAFIAKLVEPCEVITDVELERMGYPFPDDYEEWWSDAYGWQEGSEKPTHFMLLPKGPK